METVLFPGADIVTPGGVENASFALRADPGPRFFGGSFGEIALFANFEHRSLLWVVSMVEVGFIPTAEAAEAFHDGVFGGDVYGLKFLATVAFELSTAQGDIGVRIAEAVGSAVDGDEAFSRLDELDESCFLVGSDGIDIGVDEDPIKLFETIRMEDGLIFGIFDDDIELLESWDESSGEFERSVVSLIPEEENADGFIGVGEVDPATVRHEEGDPASENSHERIVPHQIWSVQLCKRIAVSLRAALRQADRRAMLNVSSV